MKLFVLGATGQVGGQVLSLALARGHDVTAFVRSPQKLVPRAGLRVIAGNARDERALEAALAGHDAVLSSIGAPARETLRASTLMMDCGRSTVRAMSAAGVKRLAIVSAAVLFAEPGLKFAFFRWMLRHHARDLLAMERVIRESSLVWTIARPPRLVGSPEATCRRAVDALPPRANVASRGAVAAFLLEAIERGTHTHEIVGLAR